MNGLTATLKATLKAWHGDAVTRAQEVELLAAGLTADGKDGVVVAVLRTALAFERSLRKAMMAVLFEEEFGEQEEAPKLKITKNGKE